MKRRIAAIIISEKVASLDGRIFNRAGDAALAEFPSPINALRCAVEIGVALAGTLGDAELEDYLRASYALIVAALQGKAQRELEPDRK